jgi:hypothetical protein
MKIMYQDILNKLIEARIKLPLKVLMEKRGRGPANGNWKTFPQCPYCEGKRCAGVFNGSHGEMFKCHSPSCRSMTAGSGAAWDEIGFLAFELGCDRRAATRVWLEEAGLWEENYKLHLSTNAAQKADGPDADHSERASQFHTDATLSETTAARSPIIAFYEALALSTADREELKSKRGLSDEAIDGAGLRTNCHANLELLHNLAQEFHEWELVESGLWTPKEKHFKPSGQFYGYGVIGKKKKLSPEQLSSGDYSDLDEDDLVWAPKESGQCNPILIPYFNLHGELVALRPHKGFSRGQQPRLYLASGRNGVKPCHRVVIVEGEFKALALQSILGPSWFVAGVPGITMIKNLDVWGDILVLLKTVGAKEIIFAFDNEEQSDPALPHYKAHLADRFEAEVWARIGAIRAEREGYTARVAHLPDEWRNTKGKADWDSALAMLLKAGKTPNEITALFEGVLNKARTPAALFAAKHFGYDAENSINNRVIVRTYEPALPWGDEAERRLVTHLRRLAEKLPDLRPRILQLAEAYDRVAGWYYELKLSEQTKERLFGELSQVENLEHIKFLKLALKGTPSRVASFRLVPCYVLVKPNGDRLRLVRIRNIRGELSGLLALDSNSLTAPRDFRRWLAQNGNFSWQGGERQLQALQQDIDFYLAYRNVIQLICYGAERPEDLWIVDDCAFAPDGTQILPDDNGIFWYCDSGYKFLRNADQVPVGEEDQAFRIKPLPLMQPDHGLAMDAQGEFSLECKAADDPVAIQQLLGNLVLHLNASYGGHDGAMLVAATLAFFAGPNLFSKYRQFPGIWITGEKGSGKTFTARWLMGLHGVADISSGLSFKSSTAVGMQIAMGQYASIPIWGDEFKESELRDAGSIGVIHGGYNRDVSTKWSADGRTRSIRSNLLVTGESACSNAATMSRFTTTVAAREKRCGSSAEQRERLAWLQRNQQFYFTIGRMILRNRARFAASLQQHLQRWEESSELAQVEPRARFTYGVSFASFMALQELMPIYDGKRCAEFRLHLIRKTISAAEELATLTDVVRFFELLVNAVKANVFGRSAAERSRYFKWAPNPKSNPPLSARQLQDGVEHPYLAWRSGILYFQPGVVISMLRKWLYSQGVAFPLSQADLLKQLRAKGYFISARSEHGHQQRFGKGASTNQYCWAIDLDKFSELGLILVSDEDWDAGLHPEGDTSRPRLDPSDWLDPRRGPIFAIVDALEENEP